MILLKDYICHDCFFNGVCHILIDFIINFSKKNVGEGTRRIS